MKVCSEKYRRDLIQVLVSITASATYEEALERAAERWGVQREYWDIWGKHHRATPEMIAAVLRSLGVDAGSREELDEALVREVRSEWQRLVPPTLVTSAGSAARERCVGARGNCTRAASAVR